jgi:hypothetical protein
MRPDCGRRPGSDDELASLGLDSVPRRPTQGLDPGEGRLRMSVRPCVSLLVILSIGLAQIPVSSVNVSDVRMIQRSQNLGLALKSGEASRIARKSLRQ